MKILGLVIGQYSDVGDANAENLSVKISRGWGTSGAGGSPGGPFTVTDRIGRQDDVTLACIKVGVI